MPIITLTTDFGRKDPDVAYLKSLILNQIPQAQCIDISHDITPFVPDEAVYIVQNTLPHFPKGSIHFIGVDSASNEEEKPILCVANDQYFLSNNNGILTTALSEQNVMTYSLPFKKNDSFMTSQIDVAKQLLAGQKPEDLGNLIEQPKTLKLSPPFVKLDDTTQKVNLIATKVIYNDNYGNAVFDLKKSDFDQWHDDRPYKIKVGPYVIDQMVANYKDILNSPEESLIADGDMFAHFNHFGYFEIFVYKSNHQTGGANTLLGLQKNQIVHIVFES